VPFLTATLTLAALLFSVALIPVYVVPWPWAASMLQDRRPDIAACGLVVLFVPALWFLLAALGSVP
jgi:hypothetical protein